MTHHLDDKDLTHSMAHYLLTVHKLCEESRRSRLVDVAEYLELARSSVTNAFKRLKERGLVEEDEDKNLRLTSRAHEEVHQVLSTRTLLYHFFRDVLHVSEKNSKSVSCEIEYLINGEIQGKLFDFMKNHFENLNGCSTNTKVDESCFFHKLDYQDFKKKQKGDSALVLKSSKCSSCQELGKNRVKK